MSERPPHKALRKNLERYIAEHGLHVTFVHDCIEDIIREAKAEAWDEACEHDLTACRLDPRNPRCAHNPYRADAEEQ